MKYFAVYVPDGNNSGEIIRSGQCPDSAVAAQAQSGESSIETAIAASNLMHKIVAGVLTEKTAAEKAAAQAAEDALPDTVPDAITVSSKGFIQGGATSYTAGDGFWMGYDATDGKYKFRFGSAGVGSFFKYNGSSLTIDVTSLRVGQDTPAAVTLSEGLVQVTGSAPEQARTRVEPGQVKIGGYNAEVKVLGERQAAVADAYDADDAVRAVNQLLARLRTHGLIAT